MRLTMGPIDCDQPSLRTRITAWHVIAVALLALFGCQPHDQIRTYKIAKRQTLASPDRMVVGFVTRAENAWFFKMSGSAADVTPHVDGFRELLTSLHFDQREQPEWELPAGWRQNAGQGMRFATLRPSPDASVSVSVINLPMPQPLLPNVNRWRGQVGLKAIEEAELEAQIERLSLADGTVLVIDLTGALREGAMTPPFAGSRGISDVSSGTAPAANDGSWTYSLPASWQSASAGPLTKATFEVRDGEQQAKLTVTVLGMGAAPVLPNVNRWRGQLGLGPVSELADAAVKEVRVSHLPATYVDLSTSEAALSEEAMLAVIVPCGSETWFFKLSGDAAVVRAERDNFDAFLDSVRLGSN